MFMPRKIQLESTRWQCNMCLNDLQKGEFKVLFPSVAASPIVTYWHYDETFNLHNLWGHPDYVAFSITFTGMFECDHPWSYMIIQKPNMSCHWCYYMRSNTSCMCVVRQRQRAGEAGESQAKSRSGDDEWLLYFTESGLGWEVFSCLSIQWKIISCKKPISFCLWTRWVFFFPTGSGSLGEMRVSRLTEDFPSAASNPPHMFLIDLHKPQ